MNTNLIAIDSPEAGPARALGGLADVIFDRVECGLIVCNDEGQLLFANREARRELEAGRLLQQLHGHVRTAPGVGGGLDVALRLAAQRGRHGLVRLTRDNDRILAAASPLSLPGSDSRLALLVLGRRRPCSELGLEMLAANYGLTLAERRVLAALVREASPREIAAEHAVKLSTVRSQISAIRAKLGTRSIDGLLLRAAEVPPIASALRVAWSGTPAPAARGPAACFA